jgi:hypothetical protein
MESPHDERADELERHADWLEEESERVGSLSKDTREDWDSKKSGVDAPGATDEEGAAPGGLGEEQDEEEQDEEEHDSGGEGEEDDEDESD